MQYVLYCTKSGETSGYVMTVRLTQASVERLKKTGKQYYVRSDDRSGFAVRVSPAGRKTYVLRFRPAGSPGEKDYTIGLTSELSCDAANKKARLMRAKLEEQKETGIKDAEIGITTLKDAFESHLQSQCQKKYDVKYYPPACHSERTSRWPRHLGEKHRAYLRVYDYFGSDMDVRKLTSLKIEEFHSMRSRTARVGANKDVLYISAAMSDLLKHKIITDNPCAHIDRNRETPDKVYIEAQYLDDFFNYLDEYANIVAAAAVKFGLCSGIRKNRIIDLKLMNDGEGNYIDFENKQAVMRDHKTAHKDGKKVVVHLTNAALECIPKRTQKNIEANPYAFYTRNNTHITDKTFDKAFNYAKKKLNLPPALAKKITPYCTRHTFAYVTKMTGEVSDEDLAKMLSHKDTQMVNKHYLHVNDELNEKSREMLIKAYSRFGVK